MTSPSRALVTLGLLVFAAQMPLLAQDKASAEALPIQSLAQPPQPVSQAKPVYPFAALVAGTTGKVTVDCVVGPQGRISQAEIKEATAPEFGQAVLAMLDHWKYVPAHQAGEPASARLTMTYEFSPAGGDVPVSAAAQAILKELAEAAPRIHTSGALDQPLKASVQQTPVYPLALREKAVAGEAVIEFFIDPNGEAQLPRIVTSSEPEFGYAAAQAVAGWRFSPPLKDGQPVIAKARIPIRFPAPVITPPPSVAHQADGPETVIKANELGAGDVQPVLTYKARPEYPSAMYKAGVSGQVTIEYVIDAKGRVREAKVVSSSHKAFEGPALAALKRCEFSPGKKAGQPVSVRVAQTIEFERR